MMKRYLVFANNDGENNGGWEDIQGVFDDQQEAVNKAKKGDINGDEWDWWMVVDLFTGQIVACDYLAPEDLPSLNEEIEQRVAQYSS